MFLDLNLIRNYYWFVNNKLDNSNSLCVSASLGVEILPVIHFGNTLPLPLEDFFIIGVFRRLLRSLNLVFMLPLHGVVHLLLGKLCQGHRGHVVPGLKHLLLVLTLEVHPIVDILVVNLNAVNYSYGLSGILVLHDNSLLNLLLFNAGSHHVRHLFDIVRANELGLEGRQVVLLHGLGTVGLNLFRSQLVGVFKHLNFHFGHFELIKSFHDRKLYLHCVELSLCFFILVVLECFQIRFN